MENQKQEQLEIIIDEQPETGEVVNQTAPEVVV